MRRTLKDLVLVSAASLLMSVSAAKADTSPTTRIVGGSDVTTDIYPWMTSIYFRIGTSSTFTPGCGGSLISDRWVLSAAHCFESDGSISSTNNVAVKLGITNLDSSVDTPLVFDLVSRIVVHPDYDPDTFANDVALLELQDPVALPTIALPRDFETVESVGENVVVAGWGDTTEGGSLSLQLQQVSLPIVSNDACATVYGNLNDVQMLCAGGSRLGGFDSCQGDSGGPLFTQRGSQHVQVGVVSFGAGCARPGIPGAYSRVATYKTWIDSFVLDTESHAGSANFNTVAFDMTLNATTSGTIRDGNSALYRVVGADAVTLTTTSGDADLNVYAGDILTRANVACAAFAAGTANDSCPIAASDSAVYIEVLGFENSAYTLTATGTPAVDPAGGNSSGGGGSLSLLALFGMLVKLASRNRRRIGAHQ